MSTYTLCTWEENGYHDSDFYAAVWNTDTQAVELVQTGTTRGAGCTAAPEPIADASMLRDARLWLRALIYDRLIVEDTRRIREPGKRELVLGACVRTSRIIRPRGKRAIAKDTWGEITWVGSRPGHYYSNGYNRPDARENLRVCIRQLDGGTFFAPADALVLDDRPRELDEVLRTAESLSHQHNYGAALSAHFAWCSANYANALALHLEKLGGAA